ncbi:MAG TPA: hypothetical protein VGS00_11065 [Thermoanaerobaculia bacterium]|nr:hypothetical protein [Thermoanaerobaculia bacterium]
MRRGLWKAVVAGLAVLAAGSAAALAADRLYDAEVRRLIASANREVGAFRKHASGDFKKAIVVVDGVDLNLGHLLEDLQDVGRKLEKRYANEYAAVPDAVLFLKRARKTDEFIVGHRGLSGADNEWQLARQSFISLSRAYAIEWASDPAYWRPARAPDAPLRRAAADFEKEARTFERALAAAARRAGLGGGHRKALEGEAETAVGAVASLRRTIDAARPTGQALRTAATALGRLEKRVGEEGLTEAASSSWRQLKEAKKIVSGYLGVASS